MKKFAFLILLATPAFADLAPFREKTYLDMVGGEPAKADAVKSVCEFKGIAIAECQKQFGGRGNLAAEAALRCEIERTRSLPTFKASIEHPGARGDLAYGSVQHEWQHNGHAHGWSEERRNAAANEAFDRRLTQINNENSSFKGTELKSSGDNMNGGFEVGIPLALMVSFNFGGENSKTISVSKITDKQIKDLKSAWLHGWNDPSRWGSDPDIIILPNGKTQGGTPAPKKKIEEIKATKQSEDKKGAENPPEAEESPTDFADIGYVEGKGEMVAVHTGPVDPNAPKFATPVAEDHSSLSPVESCVKKETKRLTDNLGRMNVDPNSLEAHESEDETAKKLLRFGYCDEQVMGKAACLAKKIKEDSVVAVTIQEERKEAAKQALEAYKLTGLCDPNALGREYCKAEKFKWETTPAGRLEIPTEGGRILKPIRSGEIPKINH